MPYNTNNPTGTNGSTDPRDLYDNAANFDLMSTSQTLTVVPDRLGQPRTTLHGYEVKANAAIDALGMYRLADQTFGGGTTITSNKQLLLWAVEDGGTGWHYYWTAEIASGGKIVPPGSTPASTGGEGPGGWLAWDDFAQRLAAIDSTELIAGIKASELALRLPAPFSTQIGGQLYKLKKDLNDPFQQKLGICFPGDSITWGMTVEGGSPIEPRSGTLTDVRNNGTSGSFVNLLRDALAKNYFPDGVRSFENWPTSPSGQSILKVQKTVSLLPDELTDDPFQFTLSGPRMVVSTSENALFLLDKQISFGQNTVSAGGATATGSIKFNFTGDTFDLVFTVTDSDSAQYQLYVDGVLQGTYNATSVAAGVPDITYSGFVTHTFTYVRDKQIEIRTVGKSNLNTQDFYRLKLEAIRINREITFSNQGIIGKDSVGYLSLISGVTAYDKYCFVQLGTNDRVPDFKPNGQSGFLEKYEALINALQLKSELILMIPPRLDTAIVPAGYMDVSDLRNVISFVADKYGIDLIDNYPLFSNYPTSVFLADLLHPNSFGHLIIFLNIYSSIVNAQIKGIQPKKTNDGTVGAGLVLREASYGVGSGKLTDEYSNISDLNFTANGLSGCFSTDDVFASNRVIVFSGCFDTAGGAQIAIDRSSNEIWFRRHSGNFIWSAPLRLWHSGNTTVDVNGFIKAL